MQKKGVRIFFSVVLALVFLFGTVAIVQTTRGKRPSIETGAAPQTTPTETTTEKAENKRVVCLSVGDNLIHDGIYEQAHKRAGSKGYDFSFCYRRVKPIIEKADIATINQETMVAKSFAPSGYPMFNSPQELGQEVQKIGFDVVNLANNHMLDKGAKGLLEAIEFWSAQEGMVKTGAYRNQAELEEVEYIESNGMKIGLVGVTQYLNGLKLPKDSDLKLILTTDEKTIERKIKKAKEACDVVMVNAHWGTEYTHEPTAHQKDLAQKMANWGADVIIGHHPHVLQPVTWLEREDGGKTLCVYSLGNFISQQNTASRVVGGMLHYTLVQDGKTKQVTIEDVSFEPMITHYVRGTHDVQIYPFSQYTDVLAKQQSSRIKQPDFSLAYIEELVKKVIPAEFLKEK